MKGPIPYAVSLLRVDVSLPTTDNLSDVQSLESMALAVMSINMLTTKEPEHSETDFMPASEMVDHICSQVNQLDDARRYMFMQWLRIHSHVVHHTRQLRENLNVWLGPMSTESTEWEYKLIMGEIRWWRDLEESRLARIMLEVIGQNS